MRTFNLRVWQSECIETALDKYSRKLSHFLCLATPGAGKTIMASVLAKRLLDRGDIDLVICFTPSLIVSDDFRETLSGVVGSPFDGRLGSVGDCLCYQSMQYLDADFWDLFNANRIFVIFDEIHHCAGQIEETANSWGQQILANIQGKATYTLAMTGTPWRSDDVPICLATYCTNNSKIICDYQYGIYEATRDGICRFPNITITDSESIIVNKDDKQESFSSFTDALTHFGCSYKDIIENEEVMEHLLRLSTQRLQELKTKYNDSAGLVVASSIGHAKMLLDKLLTLNQTAVLVTYQEKKPLDTIRTFRNSNCDWIVSVGMISEGTNIPRLRVCCYLSHVKTELYFRQVLGRVLRVQKHKCEVGYFLMAAHPDLIDYASRVKDNIPDTIFERIKLNGVTNIEGCYLDELGASELLLADPINLEKTKIKAVGDFSSIDQELSKVEDSLDYRYNFSIDSISRFRETVFEL